MSISAVSPSQRGASTISGPRLAAAPAPSQLMIDRRDEPDSVTFLVRGEIDIATAHALERAFEDVEGSAPRRILLDLADLEFIDCTGIHLLMHADARARANRHQLVVTNVPDHARRLFELTGIDARFDIR